MHKKMITLLLLSSLAIALAGCGEESAETTSSSASSAAGSDSSVSSGLTDTAASDSSEAEEENEEEMIAGPCEGEPESYKVAVNDYFKIVIDSTDPAGTWGYTWNLTLYNKTDQELLFAAESGWVNGWAIDPEWGQKVDAGQTVSCEMCWVSSDFEQCGISDVTGAGVTFYVTDTDTQEQVYSDIPAAVYPAGSAAYTTGSRTPAGTDIPLIAEDQASVTIIGSNSNQYGDYTVTLYLENKSDQDLTFSSVSGSTMINGAVSDPCWSATIPAGLHAYRTLTWFALPQTPYSLSLPLQVSADDQVLYAGTYGF